MKKFSKKSLAVLLLIVMGVSTTACNKGDVKSAGNEGAPTTANDAATTVASVSEDGVPAWQKNKDDKVKLQWYMNFSWFTTPWGEDLVSKTITEQTGVDVEFVVPAGNEVEKLNSMIASDTLPDVLTLGFWEGSINEMIDSEMVYALNELADEYDPYFWEVADDTRVNWYTKEDGNLYGYPNSSFSPADYEKYDNIASNQTFLVRKDMYEAIGSPDMSTPEGYKAAIKKAAEMYPEVNGQPIIPMGAHEFGATGNNSFDQFLFNFLAIPYEKDGKLYDRFTDPEYITWLKTFRELNADGYLADDIFIDKRAQMEEKMAQGRYFCMLYQRTDLAAQQKILYANDPNSIYMAIDGPKNSKLDPHALPGGGIAGWTVTLISKNCENPDRAIQMMSYMMSEEGQKMIYLGVEGKTYDVVDGKPVLKADVKKLLDTDRKQYDILYGADDTFWMLQDNAMQAQWTPELTPPLAQMQEWTYDKTIFTSQYDAASFSAGTEEANINLKITNEWGMTLPKLLLAASEEEFDTVFNAFVEKRNSFGYEILKVEENKQFLERKAKLNVK